MKLKYFILKDNLVHRFVHKVIHTMLPQEIADVILFFIFLFDGPGWIKFFDCRACCIHGVAAIHMKRSFSFFLESGFDPCFFLSKNENLHGNGRNGFRQFVHVCTAINAGESVFQFMTEMMQDIQADQLFVSGMNGLAKAFERHIIENHNRIHDRGLGIDGQAQPKIMQCPFCRDDDRRQKQIVCFDISETRIDVPELIISMEKLNLTVSCVF